MRKKGLPFLVTLVVCGSLSFSTSLCAQNAREIINHYLDTVSGGDIANWDKIKTVYMEGETFYSQEEYDRAQLTTSAKLFNYTKTFKEFPDKLKIEHYQDSTYTQFLSSTLWLSKENKLILSFNGMLPIIKEFDDDIGDFNPVYISKLVKKCKALNHRGIKTFEVAGVSCFDIEVVTKDFKIDFYFNVKSYLLEYWKVFNNDASDNYVKFYDYREVGGLLFEFSNHAMKDGKIFNVQRTTRIDINPKIEPATFQYPK